MTDAARLLLLLLAAGCKKPGELTVGVQSTGLGTYVRSVHVVTTVDGETQTDGVFRVSQGPLLPREVKVAAKGDGQVAVRIEGFATDDPGRGAPVITRTAHTTMPPTLARKLLRIQLDPSCVTTPPAGGLAGPTCAAPGQTCVAGACVPDTVAPPKLEDYVQDWAARTPDACRPANAGPPILVIGQGQNDYLPLADGQTVKAQAGPQGGHHIWVAIRMKNLKQSGSTTTLTATQPGSNAAASPFSVVFTFQRDDGGYCKLYGLRFQLDANGVDLKQFLGKPLDVTVTVRDALGEVGTATKRVQLDTSVLPL